MRAGRRKVKKGREIPKGSLGKPAINEEFGISIRAYGTPSIAHWPFQCPCSKNGMLRNRLLDT